MVSAFLGPGLRQTIEELKNCHFNVNQTHNFYALTYSLGSLPLGKLCRSFLADALRGCDLFAKEAGQSTAEVL